MRTWWRIDAWTNTVVHHLMIWSLSTSKGTLYHSFLFMTSHTSWTNTHINICRIHMWWCTHISIYDDQQIHHQTCCYVDKTSCSLTNVMYIDCHWSLSMWFMCECCVVCIVCYVITNVLLNNVHLFQLFTKGKNGWIYIKWIWYI